MKIASQKATQVAVIAAACITPLIVKLRPVSIPPSFGLLGYPNPVMDGFSWFKAQFVLSCAMIALVANFPTWQKRTYRLAAEQILLLAIGTLSILSVLLSPYQALSLTGVPHIFEGILTTLSYLVLAWMARNLTFHVVSKILPIGLGFTVIFCAILGIPEESGFHLVNHPILASMIMNLPDGLQGQYSGNFKAATTPFGNPNYTGMFAAMLWPFLTGFALSTEKVRSKIFYIITSILALALLLGSHGRSSFVGGALATALVSIGMLVKSNSRLSFLLTLILTVSMGCGINLIFAKQSNIDRILEIPERTDITSPDFTLVSPDGLASNSIQLDKGRLRISKDSWILLIERQPDELRFMDATYKPLKTREQSGRITLDDPRYKDVVFERRNFESLPALYYDGFNLVITPRGLRVEKAGALIRPVAGQAIDLPISEKAFTRRGFIWSRTVPILKDKWLWGVGPGSFPFEFPNNDVVAISQALGHKSIVDKPHNLYMGIAHTYGILALISFLTLMGVLLVRLKNCLESGPCDLRTPSLAYGGAILAFLISGIFNDSTVGVSSTFWIILGSAYSILPKSPSFKWLPGSVHSET